MSAEHSHFTAATVEASASPLYFGSGGKRLFAWLHRPTPQTAADIGIVICKPFGYEALCAHRSIRAFAEAAVGVGVPVLRFDYLGTGDSEDIEPNADQIETWLSDVAAAVNELRRCTGVGRVCLLGIRLGALLATLAATASMAVDALILVAPVIDGRRYVRELRTAALAAAALAVGRADAGRTKPVAAGDGSMEASGYPLSAATVSRLLRSDVSTLGQAPAREVLLIDRDDLPVARKWSELLVRLGARTRYLALPGFVQMTLTAPQFAVVSQPMLAAVRDWLVQNAAPRSGEAHMGGTQLPAVAETLELTCDCGAAGAQLTERPVFLGHDLTLFGIVAEPSRHERRRRAVILLNVGADYHIGASRIYVALARRWACRGYVVLRMDFAGLGDSTTRSGRPDNDVYPPTAVEDIRAAIDFVRGKYGVRDITLGGLCSAAYHALRAAVAGLPLNRILMVNPQNFFWKEGTAASDLQVAEVVRNPGVYRERVLSVAAWKRLLSGQVNLWRIPAIYVNRLRIGCESVCRDIARSLGIRLANDLGCELEEIVARGVRVVFVFSQGDPGIELLRLQGGTSVRRLGERCHIHIIDNADHTFSQSESRARLEQILSDELFVRHTEPVMLPD